MSDIYSQNDVNANTNSAINNNTANMNQMYQNAGYQNNGYPNQAMSNDVNNQNMTNNQMQNAGYQNNGYPNQAMSNDMNNQNMANNQMQNAGYQNSGYPNQAMPNNMNNQNMANNQMQNAGYQNNGYPSQTMQNNQVYQSSPYQSSPYPSSGADAYANNANVPNNQAYAYANGTYNPNVMAGTMNSQPYVNEDISSAGADEITTQKYNLIIGLTLLWGFFFNYLIVNFVSPLSILEIFGNAGVFTLFYFIVASIGILIFKKSSNPVVSFIGYNLLVLPIGLLLSIALYGIDSSLVGTAILLTGIITLAMMTLGVMFPKAFEKIASALGIALVLTIVVELIVFFVTGGELAIINYIVVLLFCGYIGYDWGKANSMPKTVDNAIDGAAAIYLDIINLFLRILIILSKNRRK